ncbi:hypothetical protein KKC32_00295 [Patescibacteria group bacterium]|nr:hypothetical protein [Patescibacteria group bacterium]
MKKERLQLREPVQSEFFRAVENQPPAKILLQCQYKLEDATTAHMINGEPNKIITRSARVKKYLSSFGQANPTNELAKQLVAYLIEFGAIICTTDTRFRYVLDNERLNALIQASRYKIAPSIPENIQLRLETILGKSEDVDEADTEQSAKPEPPNITETFTEEETAETTRISIRDLVTDMATTELNGLAVQFPQIEKICRDLGILADQAQMEMREQIPSSIFSLAQLIKQLIAQVEDATMNLLNDSLQTPAPIIQAEYQEPAITSDMLTEFLKTQEELFRIQRELIASAREHFKPQEKTADVASQIAGLKKIQKPLHDQLQKIRDAKSEAEDLIEDLEMKREELLSLRQHHRNSPSETQSALKTALKNLDDQDKSIEKYIATLLAMNRPLEERIRQIDARIHALQTCGKPLDMEQLQIADIPPIPEFIEIDMLALTQMLFTPEEESTETDDDSEETEPPNNSTDAEQEEPNQNNCPAGKINFLQEMALAAFLTVGPASLSKVIQALKKIGFLTDSNECKDFIDQVAVLSGTKPAKIKLSPFPNGENIYSAVPGFSLQRLNEIISPEKQRELSARVTGTKLSYCEKLVIALFQLHGVGKVCSHTKVANILYKSNFFEDASDRGLIIETAFNLSNKTDDEKYLRYRGNAGGVVQLYAAVDHPQRMQIIVEVIPENMRDEIIRKLAEKKESKKNK